MKHVKPFSSFAAMIDEEPDFSEADYRERIIDEVKKKIAETDLDGGISWLIDAALNVHNMTVNDLTSFEIDHNKN